MRLDSELEKLYRQLKNTPPLSKEQDLINSELIKACENAENADNTESLKAMLELLDKAERPMDTNIFISGTKEDAAQPAASKSRKGKFITEQLATADMVFSNIKKQVRQSNKVRVENYANTNARLVKEINVAPLQLKQYTT